MEAGIEHLGRGTAPGMGAMLAVVEPGQRSLETAARIREMAAALGIRQFGVVLNKSTVVAEDRRWVGEALGAECVLAAIPFDARIAEADRRGISLVDLGSEDLLQPFRKLQRILEERFERPQEGFDEFPAELSRHGHRQPPASEGGGGSTGDALAHSGRADLAATAGAGMNEQMEVQYNEGLPAGRHRPRQGADVSSTPPAIPHGPGRRSTSSSSRRTWTPLPDHARPSPRASTPWKRRSRPPAARGRSSRCRPPGPSASA